jgi:hypothetical protein
MRSTPTSFGRIAGRLGLALATAGLVVMVAACTGGPSPNPPTPSTKLPAPTASHRIFVVPPSPNRRCTAQTRGWTKGVNHHGIGQSTVTIFGFADETETVDKPCGGTIIVELTGEARDIGYHFWYQGNVLRLVFDRPYNKKAALQNQEPIFGLFYTGPVATKTGPGSGFNLYLDKPRGLHVSELHQPGPGYRGISQVITIRIAP